MKNKERFSIKAENVVPLATALYVAIIAAFLGLGLLLGGCSSTNAIESYAREHNIIGQRVCNTQVDDVEESDIPLRGCPVVSQDLNTGEIPNETEEETKGTETVL